MRRFKSSRSRSGMALVLVLLVLAVSVVLGAVFLHGAATTTPLSRRADQQLKARMIGESAIALALQYVTSQSDWRQTRPNGLWASSQPLNGGTYSLYCEDGSSVSPQGVVIGDGSLSDDPSHSFVLTATATYGTTSTVVRALVTPTNNAALAVADRAELRSSALIDSYSSSFGAYGGANASRRAVLSGNDTGRPAISLRNSARVNGNVLVGPGGTPASGVAVYDSSAVNGSIDALVFPIAISRPSVPAVGPSTGVQHYNSGTTVLSGNYHFSSLTIRNNAFIDVNGQTNIVVDGPVLIEDDAVVRLTGAVAYGGAFKGSVQVNNNASIDSYNSSSGVYGGANVGAQAIFATNGTSNAVVNVETQGLVRGSVYVGPGANPNTAISGGVDITGVKDDLATALVFPTVAPWPTNVPANSGNYSRSSGNTTLIANLHADDFTLNGTAILRISGHRTIRVNQKFAMGDSAQILIQNNSSLRLYVGGHIDIGNSTLVNTSTGRPDLLVIYGRGSGFEHSIHNGATVHAILDSPNSSIKLDNHAQWFGAMMVQSLILSNHAKLHHDLSPNIAFANGRLPLATPNGTLSIYPRGPITIQGNARVNLDGRADPLGFNLNQVSDDPLTIQGDAQVNANVLAADSLFKVAGRAVFSGKSRSADVLFDDSAIINADGASTPGIVADQSVEMRAYASIAPLAGTSLLAVNHAGIPIVYLRDTAVLQGDALSGPSGDPDRDIQIAPTASLTGDKDSLAKPVDLTPPARPAVPSHPPDYSYTGTGVTAISTDLDCDNLTLADDAVLEIQGTVNLNIKGVFTASGNSSIVLRDGARLNVFLDQPPEWTGNPAFNLNGNPARMTLNYYGASPLKVGGSTRISASVHAPDALVTIDSGAQLFGSFKGKRLIVTGKIHFDASGPPRVRWLEP